MRRVFAFLLLLPMSALAADGAKDARFAALEREIAAQLASGKLPSVAVGVISDGRVVYERAFGKADLASGRPATVHTAYALASLTKPITATAVLQLAERGRVGLDAPAAQYLGELRLQPLAQAAAQPRLRQLLDHTAGLPTYAQIYYGAAAENPPPFARSVARFGLLVQPPGRIAEYSNLGYGLLGQVIERQGGLAYGDYLRREVFAPLDMDDAFVDRPARGADVAIGYDLQNQPLPPLYNDTPGAGNVRASLRDMLRFVQFHLDPAAAARPVLSAAGVRRMQQQADPAALQHYYGRSYYGLGWYVRADDGGERLVWHEGGMPGASSIAKLLPQRRMGVVVLANKHEVNAEVQAIADAALRAVLPAYAPGALDATANYTAYAAQPAFLGDWQGEIHLDGQRLKCSLHFGGDGQYTLAYTTPDGRKVTATRGGIVYGDSFVSAAPLALPLDEQRGDAAPLLLLKLVRSGEVLQGSVVAYAAPARLEHLLPFYVKLRRVSPPPPR